jgi:hypothetical protein
VSKPDDPARLFDARSSTTDGVRAVLRSGQRGLPGPDELARLAARLPLGPLPPPTGAPPPTPLHAIAPIAAPSVLPGVIVGALLGLGVVAGWVLREALSPPADNFTAASVATNIEAPAPRPIAPRVADARVEAADSARAPVAAAPGPRVGSLAVASVEAPPAESAAPPATASVAADVGTEVQLLQRAQSALGADPGAALALTVEHARRFPGGSLGQERELIAVTALVALGRRPEAQARAASLLERFPGSAYRGRLESLGLGK